MLYYIAALILGIIAGFIIKKLKIEGITMDKPMQIVLFLLIFFLGVNIGNTLNLQELSKVGILSLAFSITAIAFSYIVSKTIRGV